MSPAERTRERSFYATCRRNALIMVLAPDLRCAGCGAQVEDPGQLQVDHVDGKTWRARDLSSHSRAARYWREYEAKIRLRALCSGCNSRDGGYRTRCGAYSNDEVPF